MAPLSVIPSWPMISNQSGSDAYVPFSVRSASFSCVQNVSSDTVVGDVTSRSWSADWQPTNGIVRTSAPRMSVLLFIGDVWRRGGEVSEAEARPDTPVARLVVVRGARGARVCLGGHDPLQRRPGVDVGARDVEAGAAEPTARHEALGQGVAEVQVLQAEVLAVPDVPGIRARGVLVVIRAEGEPRPRGVRVVRRPRVEQVRREEVLPRRSFDQRAVEKDVLLADALEQYARVEVPPLRRHVRAERVVREP